MKRVLTVFLILKCIFDGTAVELDQPQECEIYHLGNDDAEQWSERTPFLLGISATVKSPPDKEWKEFSFGFESKAKEPIGLLRFWKDSNVNLTVLTLKNWAPGNTGDPEEVQQLSRDYQEHLLLEEWTVISMRKFSSILTVTIDGTIEMVFPKINIEPFHFVYAYVPTDKYIDVGFRCKKGTDVIQPPAESPYMEATEPAGLGGNNGVTITIVVVFIVLGLLTVFGGGGYWYWTKKKRKERQQSYINNDYKGLRKEDKNQEKDSATSRASESKTLLDKTKSSDDRHSQDIGLGLTTLYSKEKDEQDSPSLTNEENPKEEYDTRDHKIQQKTSPDAGQSSMEITDISKQEKSSSSMPTGEEKRRLESVKTNSSTNILTQEQMSELDSQFIQFPDQSMNGAPIVISVIPKETAASDRQPFNQGTNTHNSQADKIPVEDPMFTSHGVDHINDLDEVATEAFADSFPKVERNKEQNNEVGSSCTDERKEVENSGTIPENEVASRRGEPEPVVEELCTQTTALKTGYNTGMYPDRLSEIDNGKSSSKTEAYIADEPCIQKTVIKSGEFEGAHPDRIREIEKGSLSSTVEEEPCVGTTIIKLGEFEGTCPDRIREIQTRSPASAAGASLAVEELCVQETVIKPGEVKEVQFDRITNTETGGSSAAGATEPIIQENIDQGVKDYKQQIVETPYGRHSKDNMSFKEKSSFRKQRKIDPYNTGYHLPGKASE